MPCAGTTSQRPCTATSARVGGVIPPPLTGCRPIQMAFVSGMLKSTMSLGDAMGERSVSLAGGHEMSGVQDVLYDSTHLAFDENVYLLTNQAALHCNQGLAYQEKSK